MTLLLSSCPLSCTFRLAMLETGGRDDGEFLKWQKEMKQRDAAVEWATLEKKHLVNVMC